MPLTSALERLSGELTGTVRRDEPMARHTTYRIGGPASIFAVLDSLSDLSSATSILDEEEVPFIVLGKGSNVLVADSGYVGAVLVLGREFRRHGVREDRMEAGAGCVLGSLVQEAFSKGLSGLEFAVGIPGTLGGALAMNAGTREGSIGEIVESVTVFEPKAGLRRLRGSEVTWAYRSSGLRGRGIIVEGELRVSPGDRERIRARMETALRWRRESQPLGKASAGSVFLNPPGDSAGRLIEACGLKGVRVGAAVVSPIHANFIVNEGGASARDVASLVMRIRKAVGEEYGIQLEPEIRFLGRFEEPQSGPDR